MRTRTGWRALTLVWCIGIALFFLPTGVSADELCLKKRLRVKQGRVKTARLLTQRTDGCRKREISVLDTALFKGEQGDPGQDGADGTDGADGQLRIYGDGSAGARTVSTDTSLSDENFQYTDFTVESGVTLTVESGTVIRCSGTFTNLGTINVQVGEIGSHQFGQTSGAIDFAMSTAQAGISSRSGSAGELGDSSQDRFGGVSGQGISEQSARHLLLPGHKAGGGGGGKSSFSGSSGGGSLVVLAREGVLNAGAISANGEDALDTGMGGAGGGIVVLASPAFVDNSAGTVSADGGDGGASDSGNGPGGGGGGGIIHFLAPSIEQGTVTVAGGSAGTTGGAGSVTDDPRRGGASGGGSGGDAGNGGTVTAADNPQDGSSGDAGHALTSVLDPTALF